MIAFGADIDVKLDGFAYFFGLALAVLADEDGDGKKDSEDGYAEFQPA